MIERQFLRDLIIQNTDTDGEPRVPWTEFALLNPTYSPRQIRRLRERMIKAGEIPPSKAREKGSRMPHNRVRPSAKPLGPRMRALEILQLAARQDVMTREERLQTLSSLGRKGAGQVRTAALKLLGDEESRVAIGVGPPPPTTPDDTIKLLLNVLNSVPPDHATAAIEAWHESRQAAPTEIDPAQTEIPLPDPSSSDLGGCSP